jgi:Rieske Fe-S protein
LNKHQQAQPQPDRLQPAEPQPAELQAAQPALAPGRRALLFGATVAGAAALTGCTTYDANGNGGFLGSTAASSPSASSAGGTGAAASNVLATTAEVPEGGGKIIGGKNIVITQPEAAVFKAFNAVCTHQGCIVNSIANGTIDCPCHGSEFSIKDGSVVHGPATSPLQAVAIKVQGTSIVQA